MTRKTLLAGLVLFLATLATLAVGCHSDDDADDLDLDARDNTSTGVDGFNPGLDEGSNLPNDVDTE